VDSRSVAAAMTWRTGAPTRPPLIWVTCTSGGGTAAGDPSGTGCPDGTRGGGPPPEVWAPPRVGPLPGPPDGSGFEVTVAAQAPANAAPASTTSPETISARGRRGLRA
jgi:hypothetical protein